ncbi:S8 family serine peptidase [Halobaculum sp. P14]|uniref:S8 family serine peptidase n=1 Tax=Halobaculum sp. P14 TaxID=3421638 RepID=UPI003EBF0C2F
MSRRIAAALLVVFVVASGGLGSAATAHPAVASTGVHDAGIVDGDGYPLIQAGAGATAPDDALDNAAGSAVRGDAAPEPRRSAGGAVGATDDGDSGEQVRVGVIGSEFRGRPDALTDRVSAVRRLNPRFMGFQGGPSHDTAVAEIVARQTESADLYLAAVGHSPTPKTYSRAVEWLVANDVDVIVDAGSYFPRTADGMDRIAAAAENATDSGVVFVTSAGNYAQRHWRGQPASDGWASFAPGTQVNRLGNGTVSGRVTLRLYWEADTDYDLYLYRDVPGPNDRLVRKSTRTDGHAESIDAAVPRGHYYVAVHAADEPTGPVDLFAAHHRLAYAGAEGSAVAPATVNGVIAVGAVTANGGLRAYSSTGADVTTTDGVQTRSTGQFRGTSAAAPVVAGTVAAMESSGSSLTPAEVERILERTADGARDCVDPAAAVAAARANTSAARP